MKGWRDGDNDHEGREGGIDHEGIEGWIMNGGIDHSMVELCNLLLMLCSVWVRTHVD